MDPFGVVALENVKSVACSSRSSSPSSGSRAKQPAQAPAPAHARDWSPAACELLAQENRRLQQQLEDLSGALKARDMEISLLRERCEALAIGMEEQDEVLARICAVVPPRVMALVSQEMQKSKVAVTALEAGTKIGEEGIHIGEDAARGNKMKTRTPEHKDPIEEPEPQRSGSAMDILSTAIDRLLNLPVKKMKMDSPTSNAMFSIEDALTDDSSPSVSECSSMRSLDRHGSFASEDDMAKSAGFLRRRTRQRSGKLSVSDFGLLENATQDGVADENRDPNSSEDGTTNSKKQSSGANSPRQRNLFADVDTAESQKLASGSPLKSNDNGDADAEMSYAEFLDRLRLPSSRDLFETIRLFLCSILGPRGDGKPPRNPDFVEYDFYGNHEFRKRCELFFQSMEDILLSHPVWCHMSESILANARDGIEKYVMDKIGDIAMNQLEECQYWAEEDARLQRRMNLLSFITPEMLDIKPWMHNEIAWSMAEDELRRINSFRAPGDKINCIVRCCSIIFSVLNLSRGDNDSRPGADDFLPVFIFIVLHSNIPRLYSNCEYIGAYRNAPDLMSKAGYCFVNLRSAIEFISVVDASMLSISDEDFTRLYQHNEKALDDK